MISIQTSFLYSILKIYDFLIFTKAFMDDTFSHNQKYKNIS